MGFFVLSSLELELDDDELELLELEEADDRSLPVQNLQPALFDRLNKSLAPQLHQLQMNCCRRLVSHYFPCQ